MQIQAGPQPPSIPSLLPHPPAGGPFLRTGEREAERGELGRGQDMLDGSRVLHPAPSVPTNGSSRDKPHVEGRVRDMIDGSSV